MKCLAVTYPDVGYVQGMSVLAGHLLTYCRPHETLRILMHLFHSKKHALARFFKAGMVGLRENFYVHTKLMEAHLPAL